MCCEKNYVEKNVVSNQMIFGYGMTDFTKTPMVACSSFKKSAFGGKFDKVRCGMYITRVLYNDPVTIVFWSDGTKTMSKKKEGDTYNKETGLLLCVLKKLTDGEQVARLLEHWADTKENKVDLKDVREKVNTKK